jgi:hypothetical protein
MRCRKLKTASVSPKVFGSSNALLLFRSLGAGILSYPQTCAINRARFAQSWSYTGNAFALGTRLKGRFECSEAEEQNDNASTTNSDVESSCKP